MLQNVTLGKNPTAGGTGPTVGPNVTKCHSGKKYRCLCRPAIPVPPAPRASPCNHSNLNIYQRICRNCGNFRHPLGPADLGNNTLGSSAHAISACGRTISKCPARLLRRLFEVSSPCRKNEQKNRSFSWVWQPRRPPASPPAASKRARSHRLRTLARPASTITSFHTSTTFLTHLAQLTAAHALCALRQHPGTRFCPQAPSVTDPRSPNRSGVCFSASASRPQTLAPPLRLKRSHPRAYLPTRLTPAQIAPSQTRPRPSLGLGALFRPASSLSLGALLAPAFLWASPLFTALASFGFALFSAPPPLLASALFFRP